MGSVAGADFYLETGDWVRDTTKFAVSEYNYESKPMLHVDAISADVLKTDAIAVIKTQATTALSDIDLDHLSKVGSAPTAAVDSYIDTIIADVTDIPTLVDIENSTVLAKELTVTARPTLAQMEASDELLRKGLVLHDSETVGEIIKNLNWSQARPRNAYSDGDAVYEYFYAANGTPSSSGAGAQKKRKLQTLTGGVPTLANDDIAIVHKIQAV